MTRKRGIQEFLDAHQPLTDGERELARHQARLQDHQRTNAELRRLNAFLQEELERERARSEMLLGIKDGPPVDYSIALPKSRRAKNAVVTVSLLSDTHVEERVTLAETNGRNEHNLTIAEEKLDRYFRNVVKLYKMTALQNRVVQHIGWFGGDFFTGHIHDELVEVTDLTPYQAMLWLMPRFKAGLKYWRSEMDCPILVPWSHGNHGRDGKRPRISKAAEHNLDWMLGHLLSTDVDLKGEKSIRFKVEVGYHNYVDVAGYVIRFHHGDAIGYSGSLGGLTNPLNRAIVEWNKAILANLDVLGHWHQTIDLPHVIVNGSLIGWNSYAIRKKLTPELPMQSFCILDIERRQKAGFFPVHVTRPKR